MQDAEVVVHLAFADVLGHADRRDRVERTVGDTPVVLDPDLDLIGHTAAARPAAGPPPPARC